MRWLLLAWMLSGVAGGLRADFKLRPAAADETALLKEAMRNNKQDTEHWAYTETTFLQLSKGRGRGETVVEFDPSKPYAEQFTPVKVEGRAPSEKDFKQYRQRGEKRGERLAKAAVAAADPAGAIAAPPVSRVRINGSQSAVDLEHPQVAGDEDGRLVFAVPLVGSRKGVPVDKLELRIVVGKTSRQVEYVTMRVREPFRVKLVAKVKAGELRMDFAVIDPKYGPVITTFTGNFGASAFFIPVDGTYRRTRTDYKRVTPYDDRFVVETGELKVLEF